MWVKWSQKFGQKVKVYSVSLRRPRNDDDRYVQTGELSIARCQEIIEDRGECQMPV